jgi:hypothetical protein
MALQLNDPTKPWFAKITRIKQMWLQPCQVDVFLWTLGYFAASPVLLFSIHSPDCIDYAADRVRAGHRKKRKGSVNPADMAMPIAAPKEGFGWAVFKLGGYAQKIGFHMMLIDATLDWVIYGTSFAYQLQGCRDPMQPFATIFFNDNVPYLGFLPGDHMVDMFTFGNSHIFGTSAIGITCPLGFTAFAGFTFTQKPFPVGGSKPRFTARLVDTVSGKNGPHVTPTLNPDGTRSVAFLWNEVSDVSVAHGFILVIRQEEQGIMYGSATMTASGDNYENMTKDFCGKRPIKD